MPAFNIVRFRVKAGNEQRFIDMHRALSPKFKGFLGGHLVKTGEMLEDLGGGLGVTDPVSGDSVLKLASATARKAPRKKSRRKIKKQAKKKSRK